MIILVWRVLTAILVLWSVTINCQSLPQLEHAKHLPNNSYIYYANISDGDGALKCITDSKNCCNDSNVGSWTDGRGRAVHQGADVVTCLYVTREHGEISLNRNSSCIPDTSGLWRCDVPDSSEVMQSIYIYISNDTTSGVLTLSFVKFTLHTEPSVSPPEFTITCHTQGGPATIVTWGSENDNYLGDKGYNDTSQVIVDTSQNSVYENRLRVRGRENGSYYCIVGNNIQDYFTEADNDISNGIVVHVAGEPINLTAVISGFNSTHVNITVSWKSPGDPVTGYVIYYQSESRAVSSDMVFGGESHLLDGLQRGVTYNISIVALSQHLPSLLVGPVTVILVSSVLSTPNTETITSTPCIGATTSTLGTKMTAGPSLIVETSTESHVTVVNDQLTMICIAMSEVNGQSIPLKMIIEWTRNSFCLTDSELHSTGNKIMELNSSECNATVSMSGNHENITTCNCSFESSILTITDNGTGNVLYQCKLNNNSFINDMDIVFIKVIDNTTTNICSRPGTSGSTSASASGSNSSIRIGSVSANVKDGLTSTDSPSIPSASSSVLITVNSYSPRTDPISSETMTPSHDNKPQRGVDVLVIAVAVTATFAILLLAIVCCIAIHKCKKMGRSKIPHSSEKLTHLPKHELMAVSTRAEDGEDLQAKLSCPQEKGAIAVNDFPDYVQRMMREEKGTSSRLANEYMELQNVPRLYCRVACLPHNVNYNRFGNIHPYDNSRVCLPEIPGVKGSDYINASFIIGYDEIKYIATQGPMRETVSHFWRMIWEYKIQAIVMLARCVEMSREKCAHYWPSSLNGSITPGDMLKVTLSSSLPYAEYEIRKFEVDSLLQPATNPLTVTQFHYTAWPDHGVPDNVMSIISFIRHVRKLFPMSLDQPLLVHCSAGVGRTGTFITLDTMMQQMKAEDTLSVYQCVRNLRTQRMNMVQTLLQYEFIHHALSELVVCGETEMTASSLRSFTNGLRDQERGTGLTGAQKHLLTLGHLSTIYKYDFTGGNTLENIPKNRYQNKLPNELYRVLLSYSSKHEYGYINASFINGYKQRGAYIATQGPLQNTVEDFWRMVWEYQCGCIVMLCQLVEDGQVRSYCYWPGEEGEVMVYGRLRVRLRLVSSHGDTITRKMEVTSVEHVSNTTNLLNVTMIQLISWPQQGLPHPTAITSLNDKVTSTLMKCPSKKIVVMCSDGVVRSGTFICVHSQLERLKTEGVVDVFQAIKSARIQRSGLIPNTDHYVFCYEVLANYVENMDAYANFKAIM